MAPFANFLTCCYKLKAKRNQSYRNLLRVKHSRFVDITCLSNLKGKRPLTFRLRVVGIISDGDLRRYLERDDQLLKRNAEDVMTRNPITIDAQDLATEALNLMEQKRITSLLILDKDRKIQGVIHLHDLWRTEMF
jgi:CBS domain-containing protein